MIWLWIAGYLVGAFVTLVLILKLDEDPWSDGEVQFFYSLCWPITWFILISSVFLRAIIHQIIRAAKWCAGILKP